MILADITFKWKFDYEMCDYEQTFHEELVSNFNFKMERHLNNCGVNSNYRISFDVYYFPQLRKFYIYEISKSSKILFPNLKEAHSLKEFLIWQYPDSDI